MKNLEESLSEERHFPVQTTHHERKVVVFSKGFDLLQDAHGHIVFPSQAEISKSRTAAVGKHVVITGTYACIPDLVKDGRFGDEPFIDASGFESKMMLCMPIMNRHQKIIGVTQLVNKLNGYPFTENDITMLEAFTLFCGIGIHNCLMYERACVLMAKKKVALEVLSYHAAAPTEDTERVMMGEFMTAEELCIYNFDFDDIILSDDDTVRGTFVMFKEADLLNRFRIAPKTLLRWLCSVKKNYRPVTYHNWRHALNVAQSMFCILFTGKMRRYLEDLEVLTMIVACLCHDLDHRGTNNAFQAKVDSPLAMLYSTSTMEHHHFDHSIMILNSEGNNIFGHLDDSQYQQVLKMLESAILSTDLAVYFKKRHRFKELVDKGNTEFIEKYEKELLRSMMMTACDLAACCKPWEIQIRVAELIASEFFEQGDIEKTALHEKPIDMMDRDKHADLPMMQVGFIDSICIPIYKNLSLAWPAGFRVMYEGCIKNRDSWRYHAQHGNYGSMLHSVCPEMEPMYNGAIVNREQWQGYAQEYKNNVKNLVARHIPLNQVTAQRAVERASFSKIQQQTKLAHLSKGMYNAPRKTVPEWRKGSNNRASITPRSSGEISEQSRLNIPLANESSEISDLPTGCCFKSRCIRKSKH